MTKVKGQVVEFNVKTQEYRKYEMDFDVSVPVEEPVGVDLNEVREMLEWYKNNIKKEKI